MQKIDATSAEAQSADITAENIAKLKALFPEVFTCVFQRSWTAISA